MTRPHAERRIPATLLLLASAAPLGALECELQIVVDASLALRSASPCSAGTERAGGDGQSTVLLQTADGRLGLLEDLRVSSSGETDRRIPLGFQVISAATRKPLASARAWFGPRLSEIPAFTESVLSAAENGWVRFEAPESDTVRVWAQSHEMLDLPVAAMAGRRELVLSAGAATEVSFRSGDRAASQVRLRYRTPASAPAAQPSAWLRATTGDDGLLRVIGLRTGAQLELEVDDPRFAFDRRQLEGGRNTLDLHPGATLHGMVVTEEDRPLLGVEVTAILDRPGGLSGQRRIATETDQDGTFSLKGLPATKITVVWKKDGFATQDAWVDLRRRQEVKWPTVALGRAQQRTLVVVGPAGPLPGASARDLGSGRSFNADARGRIAFPGYPVGDTIGVRVVADDHLPRELTIPAEASDPQTVSLEQGSGVELTLLRLDTGEPLGSLELELEQGGRRLFDDRDADDGEYQIGGLEAGPARLMLRPRGALPVELSLELGAGLLDLGTVFALPGATVEGVLYDEQLGAPLAGARIEHAPRHAWGSLAALRFLASEAVESDAEGRFSFSGLEGGDACLVVRHPRVAETALTVEGLREGETRTVGSLLLDRGATVRGTVVDGDSAPLSGIAVELRSGPLHSPCLRRSAVSRADGRFELPGVGPGQYFLIALRHHHVEVAQPLSVGRHREVEAELQIPLRTVRGRVRVNGIPAAGGTVILVPPGSSGFLPTPVFIQRFGVGVPPGQELLSDLPNELPLTVGADGTFEGQGTVQGGSARVSFEVLDPRTAPGTALNQWVEVAPGSAPVGLELDFAGVTVGGVVQDPDGRPLAGARVTVSSQGREIRETHCDQAAGFTLPAVPPGERTIEAKLDDWAGAVSLAIADADLEGVVIIARHGQTSEIVAEVRDEDGAPLPSATIYLTNGAASHRVQTTDRSGRARFAGLDPGSFRSLILTPAGVLSAGPAVTVERKGQSLGWKASVAPANRLSALLPGRAVGRPIELQASDGTSAQALLGTAGVQLWADETGWVRLPALTSGDWQLVVGGNGLPLAFSVDDEEFIDLR